MDYSDRNLSNISFIGKNLFEANFNNSTLINVNFYNSSLQAASFINSRLIDINFSDANLEASNFTKANFTNTNLSKTNIRGCNFSRASLINSDFRYAETGISWINIFNLVYEAFGDARLNIVAVTNGHPLSNDAEREKLSARSVGGFLALIVVGILLTCIFSKFIFTAYQNHNLFSLTATIFIALFCFTYSSYNLIRSINTLKKYSGTSFNDANLTDAKFNYALIVNTDFTDAIIDNIDWRNSRSKYNLD